MALFHVTYLGEGELVGMALVLRDELRRWPVPLKPLKARSVPKSWSDEQVALATYNAGAVRALVAMMRELRAGLGRTSPVTGEIRLTCSDERAELLKRVLVVESSRRRDDVRLVVDKTKVQMYVRDDALTLSRMYSGAGAAKEARLSVDAYQVSLGLEKLICRVAPRVLGRAGSELYAALRWQGIEIAEALEMVDALSGSSGAS